MEETSGEGHPPHAEWFYKDQHKKVWELKHLTTDKALKILKSKV